MSRGVKFTRRQRFTGCIRFTRTCAMADEKKKDVAETSLWDWLPEDLVSLVLQHRATLLVQRVWRRWSYFGHARTPMWDMVRWHLRKEGAWPKLWPFENARREWRHEALSWLVIQSSEVRVILSEARRGMWGSRARLPLTTAAPSEPAATLHLLDAP